MKKTQHMESFPFFMHNILYILEVTSIFTSFIPSHTANNLIRTLILGNIGMNVILKKQSILKDHFYNTQFWGDNVTIKNHEN
jgi:hypothetical protein